MSKDIQDIFDSFDETETALLLEDIGKERIDRQTADRVYDRTLALSGKAPAERRAGKRFRLRPAYIAAVCLLLIAAMSVGAVAIAEAEKESYKEAEDFFKQNKINSEGLSRGELKAVYKDISEEKFEMSKTEQVLITNINLNNSNAQNIISSDYYNSFTGRELWSMFNMSNSLCVNEWMLTERELFLWPTIAINYYQGAAAFCLCIPEVNAEMTCDNACVGQMAGHIFAAPGETFVLEDAYHMSPVFVCGAADSGSGYRIDSDNAAVRIKFRKDGEIIGYALVCFWGVGLNERYPSFGNGSIVKAVMLEEPITDAEADSRLEKAYKTYVVDAGLYKTESSIGDAWNDWNERNKDWYWDEYYPNNN